MYRLGLAHSFHVCFYLSFFLCTFYDIHFHNNNNNNNNNSLLDARWVTILTAATRRGFASHSMSIEYISLSCCCLRCNKEYTTKMFPLQRPLTKNQLPREMASEAVSPAVCVCVCVCVCGAVTNQS